METYFLNQIYIDANNTDRSLSAAQVKSLVLKIGAGLQKFGLQKGDCACVVSLNDVSFFFLSQNVSFCLILEH